MIKAYCVLEVTMKNIKDYRGKELLWFIVAQLVFVIVFQNPDIFWINQTNWQDCLLGILPSTIVFSFIGVVAFILDSLFSNKVKYRFLYFWGRMPGEKVFTNIKNKTVDMRITKAVAEDKYKNIYANMPDSKQERYLYENAKWYEIYSKHRDTDMMYFSHRDYLLCRDIYFATIIIVIFYLLTTLLISSICLCWTTVIFEAIVLIISNVATRQRASRFVLNVIAYDLNNNNQIAYAVKSGPQ